VQGGAGMRAGRGAGCGRRWRCEEVVSIVTLRGCATLTRPRPLFEVPITGANESTKYTLRTVPNPRRQHPRHSPPAITTRVFWSCRRELRPSAEPRGWFGAYCPRPSSRRDADTRLVVEDVLGRVVCGVDPSTGFPGDGYAM